MLKNFLLLFFILNTHLLASSLEVSTTYTKAMNFYNDKDFHNSYVLFNTIYLKKLDDVKFNFYFGRSSYETGHYEKALAAFERVEMQDDTNIRNTLEMARTYFMLGMYEDSQNAYLDVLSNQNIPDNIRTDIELSLAKASNVQKKSFTYATVFSDVLYDSNINYGSLRDYTYNNSTFGQVKELDSMALQVYANLINIYDIGTKNGFSIKNSASVYYKDYYEKNTYDVLYFTYNPSLIYKETLYTAEFVLGFDVLELGKILYLYSTSFMPRLEFNHSNTLRSLAYFKYKNKVFNQEIHHDLDANHFEFSYGLQKILSPRSYIQGNVIAIKEDSLRGDNLYVDYNEYKINASYSNQLSSTYGITAFTQLRNRQYQDHSNGFNSVRDDFGGNIKIDMTIKIMHTLQLKIGTSFEYVESNQEVFSYKKHIVSAGIRKIF